MNKKNKILVVCLTLLLALSVGYALFSETITINGTATAKGSFDMTYTCEVVTKELADSFDVSSYTKGGTGTCKIEDGVIKTISSLTKPTDQVVYKVDITNSGTIAAKLKTVDSSNNAENDWGTGGTPPEAGDEVYFDPNTYLTGMYGIHDRFGFGVSDSYMESLGFIFEPGHTESVIILHAWVSNEDYPEIQPELPKDGATMNYNISFGFEQVVSN